MSYSLDDLQKTGFLTPYIRWKEEMGYKDTDDKVAEFIASDNSILEKLGGNQEGPNDGISNEADEVSNIDQAEGDENSDKVEHLKVHDDIVQKNLKDYTYDQERQLYEYKGEDKGKDKGDLQKGGTVAFQFKNGNTYSIITKDKDGKPRPATEDEVKAFVSVLPENKKFQINDSFPKETQALLLKHMGGRITNREDVMKRFGEDKRLMDIANSKPEAAPTEHAAEQPTVETPSPAHESVSGEHTEDLKPVVSETGERNPAPTSRTVDGSVKPVANDGEDKKKKEKVVYDEKDLTKSALADYKDWEPKKGEKTVNGFLAKAGYKYRETVADIKREGPKNRWQALKKAVEQKKNAKREYKMKEGLVGDLMVAHGNSEFLQLRRGQLQDKNLLASQINALEKNHPEKFAKYRRMYEEKYISGKSDKVKENYNKKTYEQRTEALKKLMMTDLLTKKDGYLKSNGMSKPSWRKNYKKIRAEEKPIRKARRKEKMKNAWKAVTKPFVKTWNGIKEAPRKVSDYIKSIPERRRQAKIRRLENRIDKKLEGVGKDDVKQLSQQKIKQILRLQGRLDMRNNGKKVGFNDRVTIRRQVKGTSEEQRETDLKKIIDKRLQNQQRQ